MIDRPAPCGAGLGSRLFVWGGGRLDGIAEYDGEATRPDLSDQVPIVALEHVLGDAVQFGGFPGRDLPLEFKRRQISAGA